MGRHESHPEIAKRLKRAAGHLDKVIAMIEDDRPCLDVAQQLQAVANAVAKAKTAFVQDHIEHCIDAGMAGGGENIPGMVRELKDIAKYL